MPLGGHLVVILGLGDPGIPMLLHVGAVGLRLAHHVEVLEVNEVESAIFIEDRDGLVACLV